MKKLTVLGRTIMVNIDGLSKQLCELHEKDDSIRAVLAFGMLDATLCSIFETGIKESVKRRFSTQDNDVFGIRIDDFIKEINNEVIRWEYKYIKICLN